MITVVSGLPRSGTSLMMQMLAAGGLEIFTDRQRAADDDNPRGYFEVEKARQLKQDAAWLEQAEGRALKVISALLKDLPPERSYKVIFMNRRLEEILASQREMLRRRGVADTGPGDDVMQTHFMRHLEQVKAWMKTASWIQALECDYNGLLADPRAELEPVVRFLGLPLDLERMTSAIDPRLYHQRGR